MVVDVDVGVDVCVEGDVDADAEVDVDVDLSVAHAGCDADGTVLILRRLFGYCRACIQIFCATRRDATSRQWLRRDSEWQCKKDSWGDVSHVDEVVMVVRDDGCRRV